MSPTCQRREVPYTGFIGGEGGRPRGLLGIHEVQNLRAGDAGNASRVTYTVSDGRREHVLRKGGAPKESADALPQFVELHITGRRCHHVLKGGGEGLKGTHILKGDGGLKGAHILKGGGGLKGAHVLKGDGGLKGAHIDELPTDQS